MRTATDLPFRKTTRVQRAAVSTMGGESAGRITKHVSRFPWYGLLICLAWLGVLPLVGCDGCRGGDQVVVYTSIDQVYSEPILRRFEQETGVVVQVVYDTEETKSTGVLNRLIAESTHPRADVFWSGDPVRPYQLIKRGLVEPYRSPAAEGLPDLVRPADGTWVGFAVRARVLLVNKRLVDDSSMPRSLAELTSPAWRNKVAIANPLFGTTTMHVAALTTLWGQPRVQEFLVALKQNGARIASSNGEVKRLVVAGEVAVGLTDTDDAHEALKEGAPVVVIYPNDEPGGTLVIPTSAVIIKGGPNPTAARRLIDYLVSAAVEEQMAISAAHMPLRPGVPVPVGVRSVGDITPMHVDYAAVADQIEGLQSWLREWVGL